MNKTKQRWVIKAGSSLLSGGDSGINKVFIENLVSQVSYLLSKDIEVILVSSGAIAKGMHELNLKKRPSSIHLLQASAAIGQMGLINAYQEEFDKFDLKAAQILISHDDINNRNRYLNARRSIVLKNDLSKGEILTTKDITYKRPGTGITTNHWDDVIGKKINKNLEEDHILEWDDLH